MSKLLQEEREMLFNDCIGIISTYFRKSLKSLNNYKINIVNNEIGQTELNKFTNTLRLIYIISSIDNLKDIVRRIERRPSKEREVVIENYVGEIRGTIDINSYIKGKYIKKSPKTYPCRTYKNKFFLPENVLFMLGLINLYDEIINIEIPKDKLKDTQQKRIIDDTLNYIHSKIYNPIFKNSYLEAYKIYHTPNNDKIINNLIKDIKYRYQQNIIFNSAYKNLIKFYVSFGKKHFLHNLKENNLLKLYDDTFDDTLFEIWLLNYISDILKEHFDFKLVEDKSLLNYTEKPAIEMLAPNGKRLKIYYQKSKDLVWGYNANLKTNLTTTWSKYSTNQDYDILLQGNMDIIITYEDAKNYPPILIDAKNIIYENSNSVSQKVYKMIGHLDNFREFADRYNGRRGVLIFRSRNNQSRTYEDIYKSNDGATITIYSINPFVDKEIKMKNICTYILKEIGYLDGAIEISREINIQIGKSNLINQLNQAVESGREDIENEIAVEIHNILHHTVFKRFAGNEDVKGYEDILKDNYYGDLWQYIPDRTKKFLCIAEFLYNKVELLELSSAGVMYCKAVEDLANQLIITPFFNNCLLKLDADKMKQYDTWETLYYRYDKDEEVSLEIGKISRELRRINYWDPRKKYEHRRAKFSDYINNSMGIKGRWKQNRVGKNTFWYDDQRNSMPIIDEIKK
ncbi:MAG: hypothetical protein ACOCRK_06020, partial [bacterium]